MAELTPIIKDSFLQFSGAVLQSRALVDARDCMKPSARQIFYCLYTDKFVHGKPFQKTLKAIGSAFRMYIHGDSSAEGIIMRAAQPFSMRYPLIEVEGSYGTLLASGSWAAPRYTASRLTPLAEYLFADIEKEVIDEWRWNYDDTEQYPMTLPSKGFFNLVNGGFGLGVGASSSIPQYNLRELNEALIKILWNPDVSFDEIYCAPDFATGATILNADEVKESHKNGTGFSCKLRSSVDFDTKDRCLVVTEIPYMTYTETICNELEEIINSEDNPGIDNFNDLTGEKPLIKIFLSKKANPDNILKFLYKNTSLQSYYGVNFTMLENGRFPRTFTWKELLQSHIDHEIAVYTRGYEYDKKKCEHRLNILEGLLICLARIEEVVATIKASSSAATAKTELCKKFLLNEEQAKVVLDMKLSRLAHLEVEKVVAEKKQIEEKLAEINAILNDPNLLKAEVEKGLREVAKKFGDSRRTKVINLTKGGDDEEPTEIRQLQISLTSRGNLFVTETSSLYTQKRGGVGNKLRLEDGEYVISTHAIQSNEEILLFSIAGNVYHASASNLAVNEKIHVQAITPAKDWERICAMTSISKQGNLPYILFITKKGMIKKSELLEYNISRNVGLKAITLDEGDEIVNVLFTNKEKVGIVTEGGNFLMIATDDIRSIGRVAKGVRAIKLNNGDGVANARIIPEDTQFIASISGEGLFKKTSIDEFVIQGRGTKGAKIQRLNDGDFIADFFPIAKEGEVLVASTHACIKLTTADIPVFSKGALGNKSIKLAAKDSVVGISIF